MDVVKGLIREPLVHFLLIGAVAFAAYSAMQTGQTGTAASTEIRLTLDEISQLTMLFESQWRRPPMPDELRLMVENKVQQEILYREALAMGLDKDDEIVKRRMAQKMQFLAEDVAAAREPGTEELRSWFDANNARFALPGRYSFRHLYFSPDQRGKTAREAAASTLARLANEPEDSAIAATLADPFMLQDYYRDRSPEFLGKELGPSFALAIAELPQGSWQGPVESGFGWHLVYIDTVIAGRIPDFEEIESDVRTAWLAEQKTLAWDRAYKNMRDKYTVLLPGPPDEQAATVNADPPAAIQNPAASGTQ